MRAAQSGRSPGGFHWKDGGPDGDGRTFRGQERKNDTHASKTDPDARQNRKSQGAESRLAYVGHLLIENRHGLDATATLGTALQAPKSIVLDALRSAPLH